MKNNDKNRSVGADTVISSIRRISRESYTIYIDGDAANLSGFKTEGGFLKLGTAGTNYKNLTNEKIGQIYEAIKGKYFEEKIGIYQEKTSNGVSSANKQTHRIITYVQKSQ